MHLDKVPRYSRGGQRPDHTTEMMFLEEASLRRRDNRLVGVSIGGENMVAADRRLDLRLIYVVKMGIWPTYAWTGVADQGS